MFRTLVVGSNGEAEHIADVLRSQQVEFDPLGYVVADGRSPHPDGLPVLGDVRGLRPLIRASGADCLFVASSSVTYDQMHAIAEAARQERVEIRVSANLPAIHSRRVTPRSVAGIMTLALQPVRLTGAQAAIKQAIDCAVAAFGLLVSAPVMAVVAVAIRMTSPGPVLFRQRRITKGGRVFTMYKFRTMYDDIDGRLEQGSRDTSMPFFKASTEDLVTPIGRHLRRLSLDELPQLWNVLKGDMSLVGPRPLPEEQVAANPELLGPRHELRTGLTGWWQVNGRSDVSAEEAVRKDSFYIENWSLALDWWILLKTVAVLLHPRGAY